MIIFVVHLIRRSPHDYWDVISMTPATSHVAYNSKDLDHTTMRSEYLQFTSTNTFLYYLVPFLVKKMMINWKMSTYFVWVSFFSVQTLLWSKIEIFILLSIWPAAISNSVELRRSYIPLWKGQINADWKQNQNWIWQHV